jgi:hypothetical protein
MRMLSLDLIGVPVVRNPIQGNLEDLRAVPAT